MVFFFFFPITNHQFPAMVYILAVSEPATTTVLGVLIKMSIEEAAFQGQGPCHPWNVIVT